MGAGRNHIHIINMKFERELSKPLYAVTVNKGLWVSLSHPIYDFLNRKNFSCFVINEHHAYQHRGTMAPDAIGVLLEMGGHRLYFSGDTAFHEELFCGVAKFQPEIVFMSVNGKFGNMNAEEGARAAELTGAWYAVPCHCWTFAEHGGDPGLFCECLRGGRCVPVCFRQGEAQTLDCKRLFQQMEESA